MKKFCLLLAIFLLSLLVSIILFFLIIETFLRIQKKGFIAGIKSYFVVETPYSALGTDSWVIPEKDLGYRLNPKHLEINEYSMKDKEIVVPKPTNLKRIVILGDSVPYLGNPNFVDILKKNFSKQKDIEIINASTPGYTNYQELIFLKKYILQIKPDIVILNYVLNDNHKFLHKFDEKGNMLLTDEAKESLSIETSFDKLISESYFLSRLKFTKKNNDHVEQNNYNNCFGNSIDLNTAWKDESWPEFGDQLKEMNDLLKESGSKLLVVIFPLECQIKTDFLYNDFEHVTKPQKKVMEYSQKYGISYLDLFTPFYSAIDKNRDLSLYTDGIHLTKEGHRLSAQEIEKFITDNLANF